MESYNLKRQLRLQLDRDPGALLQPLSNHPQTLLDPAAIRKFAAIDPRNARLRALNAQVIESTAWQLLWIPPSLPYYEPPRESPYADPILRRFTKRLVFSSWHVVPKAVATLLSYEAERWIWIMNAPDTKPQNTPEARRRMRGLRLAREDGRASTMSVFGLLYPSPTLARIGDPLRYARAAGTTPTLNTIIEKVESQVAALLKSIVQPYEASDRGEDPAWYWAAPLLLDLQPSTSSTEAWFAKPDLARTWASIRGNGGSDIEEEASIWEAHVKRARQLVGDGAARRPLFLGKPPQDLAKVLARLAIAGPGTAALRALGRITGRSASFLEPFLRTEAARIGWAFRSLFTFPEAVLLVHGPREEPQEHYWRQVLQYCLEGNLQAVLDEYMHVLRDVSGLAQPHANDLAQEVANRVIETLHLRTASLTVDHLHRDPAKNQIALDSFRMHAHFALRFGIDRIDDSTESTRPDQVRNAFNSPFWPFVLVTTSIGQEGLDFHPYCHAVVHWNLPANPVDLEQREGRVHRFKNHAVRKNLASAYRLADLQGTEPDPWAELFSRAVADRPAGQSDLTPFWLLPIEGGARIERYVPALPLSRDTARWAALRQSLVVYRMVFGQSRQEDYMAYLVQRLGDRAAEVLQSELRINLEPPLI
jgi:hypothetical protein